MRYLRARTVEEAVTTIGDGAIPLGGGTVVVQNIAQGAAPKAVVDLGGIASLHLLEERDGALALHIGAMVTLARLADSPLLGGGPDRALRQAALAVGNPNVRRAATVGGNVALPGPTCDLHPALLALGATIDVAGGGGEQALPASALSATALPAGALLVRALRVPRDPLRRSAFVKLAWRAASGITVVAVAAALRVEAGAVTAAALAVSGLRARAFRLPRAEQALLAASAPGAAGAALAAAAEAAADAGAAELPFERVAAPGAPGEAYRRRLVREGIRRVLAEAARP